MNNGLYSGVGGPTEAQLAAEVLLLTHSVSVGDTVITLPQVFSPQYDTYRMEMIGFRENAIASVQFLMRVVTGGAIDTGTNYIQTTTGGAPYPGSTSMFLGNLSNLGASAEGFTSETTFMNVNSFSGPHWVSHKFLSVLNVPPIQYSTGDAVYAHVGSAPLTGFTLFTNPSVPLLTGGIIRIYARQK